LTSARLCFRVLALPCFGFSLNRIFPVIVSYTLFTESQGTYETFAGFPSLAGRPARLQWSGDGELKGQGTSSPWACPCASLGLTTAWIFTLNWLFPVSGALNFRLLGAALMGPLVFLLSLVQTIIADNSIARDGAERIQPRFRAGNAVSSFILGN